jgi:hypothetical protein
MPIANYGDSSKRVAFLSVACLLWVALVIILDHFWVFTHLSALGECLEVEFSVKVPSGNITLPPLSLIVFLGFPMLALWLFLVPWRSLRSGPSWRSALVKWSQPIFWLGVAAVLTVLGQSVYLLLRSHLSQGLVDFSEAWALDITIKSWDHPYATLDVTLCAIVGLAIGGYLFVAKGLRGAVE